MFDGLVDGKQWIEIKIISNKWKKKRILLATDAIIVENCIGRGSNPTYLIRYWIFGHSDCAHFYQNTFECLNVTMITLIALNMDIYLTDFNNKIEHGSESK